MKNSIMLKKKIISDSQLSFSFFLNNVNYKKLKSIGKLQLLPQYIYYRFLRKNLKTSLISYFFKNFIQFNNFTKLYFPGHFLQKRMFYKNVKFLTESLKANNNYMWYNNKVRNLLVRSKSFNKINIYPIIGGVGILSNSISYLSEEEVKDVSIILKDLFMVDSGSFNFFIFFNCSLMQIKELYVITNILLFYRLN